MADDNGKKWWKFDVQNTPCARESLILGITGGMIVGSLVFIKTKKVRSSCDYAIGSFASLSLLSWGLCSFKRYHERERVKKAVGLLNEYEQKRTQHSEPKET